jgi:hypothetical protein
MYVIEGENLILWPEAGRCCMKGKVQVLYGVYGTGVVWRVCYRCCMEGMVQVLYGRYGTSVVWIVRHRELTGNV